MHPLLWVVIILGGMGLLSFCSCFAFVVYRTNEVREQIEAEMSANPPDPSAVAAAEASARQARKRTDAWLCATHFVEEALKVPDSADFGGVFSDRQENTCHEIDGSPAWQCFGWVKAQNAFGVTLRQNWTVDVIPQGESCTLVKGPTFTE